MAARGRPLAQIDLKQLQSLCEIACTDIEIAHFFGVDVATIERHRARFKEFREACEKGRAVGRISLRRKQMQAAVEGNPTMLIWMGKQLLGQRDVLATEFSGPDQRPAEINVNMSALDVITSRIARLAERRGEEPSPERTNGSAGPSTPV